MNSKLLKEKFIELYGEGGDIREYFSPGRVNLIGEHTDYNGGHVFPCALTIGTYGIMRRRTDKVMKFSSANIRSGSVVTVDLSDISYKKKYNWANYPLGIVWAFKEKGIELESGFEMIIWGNIPNGSGLSSSASIEVLMGKMLQDQYSIKSLSMLDLALIGQYSENNFNGCNCGIMDQFAVAMGKKDNAMFLDTSDLSYQYAKISLPDEKIVIINSKVKHSLVDSAYNERREQCAKALEQLQKVVDIKTLGDLDIETFEANKSAISDEIVRKRAKHAVYENQRTIRAVEALKRNDVEQFGKLMNESHISLRDDYEVSCKEIDILVELAWETDGVIGSRITGGGFGGCTVSIVRNDAVDVLKEHVEKEYEKKTGLKPEIYIVDIGDGARRI
ncbi:MAG: galactokinase [Lachnospiraceae bacterium]|nr:galactokinase [Lachnospiraceae bacterium]